MKLIDMKQTPHVNRIQFANLESKEKWEAKFLNGGRVYHKMEYLSVAHDMRKCMIDHYATPYTIDEKAQMYAKLGLVIIPMEKAPMLDGFAHSESQFKMDDTSYSYRSVVAKSLADAEEFLHYHNNKDHIEIGRMLGYPKSSCEFFNEIWGKGYYDPIWQQAENTKNGELVTHKNKNIIQIPEEGDNWLLNQAMRYFGIRTTFHMPISYDDKESLEVARNYVALARELGLDGIEDVIDILKLPYKWDCLKSIAIVTTPVFKTAVSSVPCYPHYIVQHESSIYPSEAPNGLGFPFQLKKQLGEM